MGKRIDITPGFCILWSLLLLTLPWELILTAGAAAAVHECCHWAAIYLLGGRVLLVRIGAEGTVMETEPMGGWRELLCALAGPAGSFLLTLLYGVFPYLALLGFLQGCFNLLPLYPLDGGRAVRCILAMLDAQWLLPWIEWTMLLLLLILAVGMRMGWGPIAVWCMLAMRKIPCKDARFGVQ